MSRRIIFLCCFLAIFLVGCAGPTSTFSRHVVVDGLDRPVEVPSHPQRIMALDIATSEMAILLVNPQEIIAVSHFMDDAGISNLSEEARKIPQRVEQNVEHILSLQPDLILVTSPGKDELIQQLEGMHIPLFVIRRPYQSADIIENLKLVGKAVGQEEKANKIAAAYEKDLSQLQENIASLRREPPQVLRISMLGPGGGKGSNIDAVIQEAKCRNVAVELGLREGVLAHEQIVGKPIDYLLMPTWDFRGVHHISRFAKLYLEDPTLQEMPAIRNQQLLYIPDYYTISQTVYRYFAIEALAHVAYGVAKQHELRHLLPPNSIREVDVQEGRVTNSQEYRKDI